MVLVAVGIVAVIAAFWFVILAPKRSHVDDLKSQVSDLQSQLSAQQQTIATAQQARATFAPSYRKLVVLGKAVPADSDQASMLVQLNTLAEQAGVSFESLTLNQATAAAPVAPPPTTDTTSTSSTSTDTTSTATTSTDTTSTDTTSTDATGATASTDPAAAAATATVATEATAALLPLGASVGPAGLPVMPYDLTFTGGYFQISKFLHSLDALVHTPGGGVTVRGRLLTVNSFDLSPVTTSTTAGAATKSAGLEADLSVTTYVTPSAQGLTAGATLTGPAPTTASTAVPTATPATPTTP
jgi:Tfp pilus assembly protein PilO